MNSVAELAEELIELSILSRAIQASSKPIDRCNPVAVPQF